MKIIHKDTRKNIFKLKVENPDDLWYLSQLIEQDDIISGKTIRKIKKAGSENERNQNIARKPVFLRLKVEKVEFHETSTILRVSGTITEGPEDISLGSHHTFNIEENTIFSVNKQNFLKYHKDILNKATEEKATNILIVVFDREEATFARLKPGGYEILSDIKGKVQKKDDPGEVKDSFYKELVNLMKDYVKRYGFNKIILGSSSILRNYIMKELEDEDISSLIFTSSCNNTGKNGINEILKRDETRKVLKDERTAQELSYVEELLKNISLGKLSAYGIRDVKSAAEAGSVETLLVTDKLIRDCRAGHNYRDIEKIMQDTEKSRGHVHIISSAHEGGQKLDGIGGIGAVLRFNLF